MSRGKTEGSGTAPAPKNAKNRQKRIFTQGGTLAKNRIFAQNRHLKKSWHPLLKIKFLSNWIPTLCVLQGPPLHINFTVITR